MPEPSLSELSNIASDASLGTAGLTDFVPKMHEVNQQIHDAAKFKAQMDWQKYTTFLNNFKDITKDANEIAKMDIAANDREYLQSEMKNIFSEIEKNPKDALGGNGMAKIQERLQKLTSDATLSKQDNLYDKYHRMFLDRVPDMKTEENKGKVEGFLSKQKLGQRQPYMLDQPIPEFDGANLFSGLLKNSTRPFSTNELNPLDEAGNKLEGYIKTETGDEVNPKTIKGLWDLALSSPALSKSINKRYDALPPEIKAQYDANGGVKKFFEDLGKSYLQAQFPEGSYQASKEGNYRFNKKSELKPDPNYLSAQKLAQQIKDDKEKNGIAWYNAKTARINATKPPASATANNEDENGNIIYGVNGKLVGTEYEIKNGAVVDKDGNVQPVSGEFNIPASYFDNSILAEYNKYAGAQKTKKVKDEDGKESTVIDDDVSAPRLKESWAGGRTVRFKDGVIVGIETNKGDFATDEQFKYITNQANIKGVKKYQRQVDISGGKEATEPGKKDGKKTFPLPNGQARTVKQGAYTYVWDETTGEYK